MFTENMSAPPATKSALDATTPIKNVIRSHAAHGYICGKCLADNIMFNSPLTTLPRFPVCHFCGCVNHVRQDQRRIRP